MRKTNAYIVDEKTIRCWFKVETVSRSIQQQNGTAAKTAIIITASGRSNFKKIDRVPKCYDKTRKVDKHTNTFFSISMLALTLSR